MIIAALLSALFASVPTVSEEATQYVLPTNATAAQVVAACRRMIPANVTIEGHINRRSRRGTEIAAYTYKLTRRGGATELQVFDKDEKPVEVKPDGQLLDTDVTWSDLTLDYLQWSDCSFDPVREQESVQTISCQVLLLKKGTRTVRVWIDRKTGALMQAEELEGEEVLRRMFGTSLKKFDGVWAPRTIEVGKPSAKYRTKIVVDKLEF